MSLKRRKYTKEFKQQVLRELEGGLPIVQVARQHDLSPNLIQRWQQEYTEYGEEAFSGNGRSYKDQARIAELERTVGRQTLEVIYLQRLLRRYEQTGQKPAMDPPDPNAPTVRSESQIGGGQ
jgi:transposase